MKGLDPVESEHTSLLLLFAHSILTAYVMVKRSIQKHYFHLFIKLDKNQVDALLHTFSCIEICAVGTILFGMRRILGISKALQQAGNDGLSK